MGGEHGRPARTAGAPAPRRRVGTTCAGPVLPSRPTPDDHEANGRVRRLGECPALSPCAAQGRGETAACSRSPRLERAARASTSPSALCLLDPRVLSPRPVTGAHTPPRAAITLAGLGARGTQVTAGAPSGLGRCARPWGRPARAARPSGGRWGTDRRSTWWCGRPPMRAPATGIRSMDGRTDGRASGQAGGVRGVGPSPPLRWLVVVGGPCDCRALPCARALVIVIVTTILLLLLLLLLLVLVLLAPAPVAECPADKREVQGAGAAAAVDGPPRRRQQQQQPPRDRSHRARGRCRAGDAHAHRPRAAPRRSCTVHGVTPTPLAPAGRPDHRVVMPERGASRGAPATGRGGGTAVAAGAGLRGQRPRGAHDDRPAL
eukprot:scaffold692_cov326-Prasinococcus_capsulatus_cf.AAC.2